MKGILLLPFMLVCFAATAANRIDSLKTDQDVEKFLISVNANFGSPKYNKIELRSSETIRVEQNCDGIADQWKVNNWEKVDFNGDGLTDLLVTLYWYNYGVYTVIDKGNNRFELLPLSYNVHDRCKLAKPVLIDGKQALLFYGRKDVLGRIASDNKSVNKIDTLIFTHGDFVELNRHPASYGIDSVQFFTSYCFGSCPVFKISFDKSGAAEYIAGSYNPKEGDFRTTIKQENLEEIKDLVNYLSITNLPDNFSVSWTDDQTASLRIRFSDGSVKEIRDYGMRGTFGLRLLYDKLFQLRINQEWK